MQLITNEGLLQIVKQATKLRSELAPLVVQRAEEIRIKARQWRAKKNKSVRMVDDLHDADGSLIIQPADVPVVTEAEKGFRLAAACDAALRWQGVEPMAPLSWFGEDEDVPADQLLAANSYRVLMDRISRCDPDEIAALQTFVDDLTSTSDVSPTPAADLDEVSPALTENQSRVLQTMADFDGSLLLSAKAIAAAMKADVRLSEETVRQCVAKLVEVDLAERPDGPRSGARLNNKGRRLAGKIAG